MNRRDAIKTIAAGLSPAILNSCATGQERRPASAPPNVILIMADDLGYECLGCYGSTSYRTPVLDRLAETGARFGECHAQPLCTPSRVKIMTGKYNFRNYQAFGVLDPEERTFAHMMRDAGYATCAAGKWQLYGRHGEWVGKGSTPEQAGFDEYCLWQVEGLGNRYWDPAVRYTGEPARVLEGRFGPDVYTDFICDFMEKNRNRPFFAYFPMCFTHNPFVPTPDSDGGPRTDKKSSTQYFGDMVNYMDKLVGRLMAKLELLGLRENTLVIFTGDNGTHNAIVSELGNRTVRGGKSKPTDAGTHVPLIASWPGVISRNTVSNDLIGFSDFVPTLADATGVSPLPGTDGRSFFPQMCGKRGDPRDWLLIYYPGKINPGGKVWREPACFVRERRWKLYANGALYDLENDIEEKRPIAPGTGSRKAERARERLRAVFGQENVPPVKAM